MKLIALPNQICALLIIGCLFISLHPMNVNAEAQPGLPSPDAAGPVVNINTGENFTLIQDAIFAPNTLDGHTIQVSAGTYNENLFVPKALTIIGDGRDTTFINGNGAGDVVNIVYDWVNLTGFTFMNGDFGVYIGNASNAMISDNNISGNENGIATVFSNDSSINNNLVVDNAFNGITLDSASTNCIVENNYVSGNTDGIVFYYAWNNTIANNNVSDNIFNGFWMGLSSSGNTIYNNTVLSNTVGMHIENSTTNTIGSNNVSGNDWGITFWGSHFNTIENNTVHDQASFGMYFEDYSYNNTIRNNTISSTGICGLAVEYSDNNHIYHNNFINNAVHGSDHNGTTLWDDGYPSGGNYWDNWTTPDAFNGPLQDIPGYDNIVDFPLILNGAAANLDNYPLTNMNGWLIDQSPPEILTSDVTTATESVLYYVDYEAFDPDYDPLIWNLNSNASWLSINSTTGELQGTPSGADIGSYWVNVSVDDGNGGSDTTNFTLTVYKVNNVPVIVTPDVTATLEDELYWVDYNATDADGDVLSWALNTNATWLSINTTTGVLEGTPSNDDVGSYWVEVTVDDGNGGSDSTNFTLTVQNTNDAPIIDTPDQISTMEDEPYLVDYNATDADGDILTWTLDTNATWLSINSTTGELEGTPSNDDVGSYRVNVSVSDGNGGTDSTNFTLTVINVNDPPVIITPDVTSTLEDELYQVDYNATDIDGDTLTWFLWTDAPFLTINNVTGVLSGTPGNSHVGNWAVNVTVSDGNGGTDWANFTLTVINVNDPPVITTIDDPTATEDIPYYVDYEATDIDPTSDVLTWALDTNATWLSINATTGELEGTPSNADVGSYWVEVTVDDGNNGSDTNNFTLTVENVNDAPVITTIDDTSATEDVPYYVDYEAIDIDGDTLTWALSTSADWLGIDAATGELSGTPGNADVGGYWVNVSVSDGNGGFDYSNFTLTVANVNDPPVITTADLTTATEDVLYYVDYEAIDPDGDTITWTMGTNGTWLSIDETTGVLSGTPANEDVGSYWVNITASDGNGGYDHANFALTVSNVNDAPYIDPITAITAIEDTPYLLDVTPYIGDIDNTIGELTISIDTPYGLVDGKVITLLYPDGVLSDSFTVTVSDGQAFATQTVYVTVIPVNDAPVLDHITNITITEGEVASIQPSATDIDSKNLTFTYSGLIPGVTMPQTGAEWAWTTDYTHAGQYEVLVEVSDGNLTDNQTVYITVLESGNHAPVLDPISDQIINENESFSIQATATDPDGDAITYSLVNPPAGMTIDENTGMISWIPSWDQVGNHTITVYASDGTDASTTTFTITVLNVNNPPVPCVDYSIGISSYSEEPIIIDVIAMGVKYHMITIELVEVLPSEEYIVIENATIIRVPDDPKDRAITISTTLNMSKNYSLVLTYTADSQGGTPVWTTLSWGTSSVKSHYVFNERPGRDAVLVYDLNSIMGSELSSPRMVHFDASSSWDPDNNIVSYIWDFGDGNTESGIALTHEYDAIGIYTVTLTVVDSEGLEGTISFTVNLTALAHEGNIEIHATPYAQVEYIVGGDEGKVLSEMVADPSDILDAQGLGWAIDFATTGGTIEWAHVIIPYSEADLPEGVDENDLRLYYWNPANNAWELVENSGVNAEENYIWGNLTHFSTYAIMSDTVNIIPAPFVLPPPLFLIVGLVLGALMISLGSRNETLVMLLAVGLFPAGSDKDNNEIRGEIKGMIMARPGIHYRWIKIQSGRANGTVAYHLSKLEKDGEIFSKRDGMFKRFYPTGVKNLKDSEAFLEKSLDKVIIEILREHPGASISEIGYLVDEPRQKIHYHISKMYKEGKIRVAKDESGNTECYITERS